MLARNSYPPEYVDSVRARLDATVRAFRALPPGEARDALGSTLFPHLLLALDDYFVHRQRTLEGKDGNPLNEVRAIADSLRDASTLVVAKSVKWRAETTVLGLAPGDAVALSEQDFTRLSAAFLTSIEQVFAG